MNDHHKKKLTYIIVIFLLVVSAIGLVLYALKQNINLFCTPEEVAKKLAPVGRSFRLGGLVAAGSIRKDPQSLKVNFNITDKHNNIPIEYTGVLPDLFREKQSVVVEGKLNVHGQFIATQVLAKHDEKYMPKEVRAALGKV